MKTAKTFVIDRKKWYRGKNGDQSALHVGKKDSSGYAVPKQDVGKQCCLGIYLTACGIKKSTLTGIGEPLYYKGSIPKWMRKETHIISDLIFFNDDMDLDEDEREEIIMRMFQKANIKVVFKN